VTSGRCATNACVAWLVSSTNVSVRPSVWAVSVPAAAAITAAAATRAAVSNESRFM
jgi:hypothetical protein